MNRGIYPPPRNFRDKELGGHRAPHISLLTLLVALFCALTILPTRALAAEPVVLGEEGTTFGSADYDDYWHGTKEETYPFRLNTNSSLGYYLYTYKPYDSSGSATVEVEVLDSTGAVIEKAKDFSSGYRKYLLLPKGDYSFRVKQTASGSYAGMVQLTAYASTRYEGTNYQVISPINRDITHAAEINLEKLLAVELDGAYSRDYENRPYAKFYYKFTLDEPTNVKFFDAQGAVKLSLVDSSDKVLMTASTPYDEGYDTYYDVDLDCGRLEAGTHYVRIETIENPVNDHSAYGSQFAMTIKTGHEMYRMYNPYTGEHLYTADRDERSTMEGNGWQYESVMWYAPVKSDYPVYRLYNPWTDDHHYTIDPEEYEKNAKDGWKKEGIVFYSFSEIKDTYVVEGSGVPVSRLFNPYKKGSGTHHYSTDWDEVDTNIKAGWKYEGYAWTGVNWDYSW